VVGDDEELRGVGERGVVGEGGDVHVPVHGHDREVPRGLVDLAGDGSGGGVGGERAIRMQGPVGHVALQGVVAVRTFAAYRKDAIDLMTRPCMLARLGCVVQTFA
jgi:hypothetical protein